MLWQSNLHCNTCQKWFETLRKTTCASKQTHARLSEVLWPNGGGWLDQQGLVALPWPFPKNQLRWRPGTLLCHAISSCKAFQAACTTSSLKHYYHIAWQRESWLWVSASWAELKAGLQCPTEDRSHCLLTLFSFTHHFAMQCFTLS